MEDKQSAASRTKLVHGTEYAPFDWKSTKWWEGREMGSPDDPYNKIPKLEPSDPSYNDFLEMAEKGFESMYKEFNLDEGWVDYGEVDGIRVHSKDIPNEPIRCFRGKGIIHATAEVIRLHLVQLDLRPYWDEMFIGGSFLMEITESVRLVYYKFSAPWPVTSRDFVVCAGEKLLEDGTYLSVVHSVEREEFPDIEGFVRGYLSYSGFVVKPIENDADGRPRCEVTYLAQVDPKGWIPTLVVNLVNKDQPMCINKLRNAILLTQVMMEDSFVKMFELPESEWKAPVLKKTLLKVVDYHNGKVDMLLDPISHVVTGTRKPSVDVWEDMERQGKEQVLTRAWQQVRPYCECVANRKMYELAAGYWKSKSSS